jgi:hypothetical protein
MAETLQSSLPRDVTFVLSVILCEIFLFGSGQLLHVGPLTVRMCFYGGILLYILLNLGYTRVIDREAGILVLAFLALTTCAIVIGFVNGADVADMGVDVKPHLFFLTLPFFIAVIRDDATIQLIARLLRRCGLALAIGYLVVLLLLRNGIIPFTPFYLLTTATGEVLFRGSGGFFIYKGFLYLGIAFFFYATHQGWFSKFAALLILVALVLTLTRGFVLSLALVGIIWSIKKAPLWWTIVLVVFILLTLLVVWPWVSDTLVDRTSSNITRISDIKTVFGGITPLSLFVGHGLGTNIGMRGLRIEPTYLELLQKQGFLGLTLWGSIAGLLIRDLRRAKAVGREDELLPFFLGAMYVYVQTATNPFLTDSMGMSVVFIALAVGRVTAKPVKTLAVPSVYLSPL